MILLLSEIETCVSETPAMTDHSKRDMGSLTVSLAIALCKFIAYVFHSNSDLDFFNLF